MKKTWKKFGATALAGAMAASVAVGLTACGGNKPDDPVELKQGTYRTYTTVLPSNWNELTYADNNDSQILDYLHSSFYEYDYEFDEAKGGKFNKDGSINYGAIVDGGFATKYSAATALTDVTSSVDAKWGYTAEQKSAGGYAWKITLREDLKWDDGTPIDASDFVYTMEQQLDPLFFNMRASTYYNNIRIKNARQYLYHTTAETYESYISLGYETPEAAVEAGKTVYFDVWNFWGAEGYVDADGNEAPQYVSITDETVYDTPDAWASGTAEDAFSGKEIYETYRLYFGDEDLVVLVQNTNMDVEFEDVGIYAPSKYEIVVCLDAPIQMLKEDGSLSYLAAYNFQNLPLVKKALYEKCKIAPQEGSTLWTSNYNSSLSTSASWGPYKLTQFQSGKSYTLTRNENWYGYTLDDNKNQYNVTAIECEKISELNTQWLSFLGGSIDDIGLDVSHKDDYRNSKYTFYAPGTGTFGIQLYSNLDVLKKNGRNNGILAIQDFRKAISLYLDRDDYNATVFTSHRSCYGLLGPSYYYDVENGGVYRDTQTAKEALLRVYGFEQKTDGTWTDGTRTYSDYNDAYEAMNGMNRTLAKELVNSAYTELTENAEKYGYDAAKKITIKYGSSADNENTRRSYNYFVTFFADLVKDTPLEGKVELEFDASAGSGWADAFKSGAVDFAAATGFSGGAFDPEGFLQCYVDAEAGLMYSTWWETNAEMFTYTMPEGDYAGAGQELTMSVCNWYRCLNAMAEDYYDGKNGYTYNWGAGAIPEEARMKLLGALEELILNKYYTVITTSEFSATVFGAKFSNASTEYNIFMGFGGYRYMVVNYTDSEWDTFVKSQNNDLSAEYKKTN